MGLPEGFSMADEARLASPTEVFQALGVDPVRLAEAVKATLQAGCPRYPPAGLRAAENDGTGLPGGYCFAGPDREAPDVLETIAFGERGQANRLVDFMPLRDNGVRVNAAFAAAEVLPEGVSAWVTLDLGDRDVTFHDTRFCLARGTYRPGDRAAWRLSAVALDAGPGGADDQAEGRLPASATDPTGAVIDLSRLVCLMQFEDAPGDFAEVRGRVVSVRATQFLGVDAWEVEVELPADLDASAWLRLPVLVGRVAWTGRHAPAPGGMLEGRVLLQGYREGVAFESAIPG